MVDSHLAFIVIFSLILGSIFVYAIYQCIMDGRKASRDQHRSNRYSGSTMMSLGPALEMSPPGAPRGDLESRGRGTFQNNGMRAEHIEDVARPQRAVVRTR